jgi:ureidoacrylate peracid hydrolase
MHASKIPASALERLAKRGPVKTFVVDPAKTAHVVIDLQNGFCAPGAISEVPVAREITPNVNRIAQALRKAGGQNVFIRFKVDPDEPHYWASWYARLTDEMNAALSQAFAVGAEPYALWSELDVRPEDWIVDKTRLSAFIPGTCKLHDMLQERGIDTLIVTGTLTNACCESTVRDAMQMGYKVLFIQDGNATWDDEAHNATLGNMAMIFADVCTADQAIERLGQGAMAAAE